MKRLMSVLAFVAVTFFCWGAYGPLLHEGQEAMDHSRWRPFICVGVAYFLIAVCLPLLLRNRVQDAGRWSMPGVCWSLLAGAVGAFGALGVLLAFGNGGRPLFVMPLVFGFAPVVNTVFTMLTAKTARQVGVVFLLGIAMVALGGAGVLRFKPIAQAQLPAAHAVESESSTAEDVASAAASAELQPPDQSTTAPTAVAGPGGIGWLAVLFVAITAICWGTYGPLLHRGQAAMSGSRMRPFICVGISYFLVAIVFPVVLLLKADEPLTFPLVGSLWSLFAGTVGAIGALGVIMAFNSGGRPVVVMPLVFGGAPIVNTLISLLRSRIHGELVGTLSPWFIGSLLLVIMGSATVLIFAPKAPHATTPESSPEVGSDTVPEPAQAS